MYAYGITNKSAPIFPICGSFCLTSKNNLNCICMYLLYVYMFVDICVAWYEFRGLEAEESLQRWALSPSLTWVPGIQIRLSTLVLGFSLPEPPPKPFS